MLTDTTLEDLGESVKDSLAVLREVARSKSESGAVRVEAAKAILDFATTLFSLSEEMDMDDEDYDDED